MLEVVLVWTVPCTKKTIDVLQHEALWLHTLARCWCVKALCMPRNGRNDWCLAVWSCLIMHSRLMLAHDQTSLSSWMTLSDILDVGQVRMYTVPDIGTRVTRSNHALYDLFLFCLKKTDIYFEFMAPIFVNSSALGDFIAPTFRIFLFFPCLGSILLKAVASSLTNRFFLLSHRSIFCEKLFNLCCCSSLYE